MKRKEWQRGFEKFFKDADVKYDGPQYIPTPDWIIDWRNAYKLEFTSEEEFERTKAMIEFCTKYENESFELFYKWFKKKDREEG